MSEKSKFVQMSCDFYNQHSESDKQWFARNYDQCDEPHQKDNLCMHKWQFPLYVLRSQQAEIDRLKQEKQQIQNRFNFLLDKNIRNEADHASLKLKISDVILKWKKESDHADCVASEDFVQNVLDACIEDLEKALNVGDTPCAQTNSPNFPQAIGLKYRRSLHELHCKNRLKQIWGVEDWCDCQGGT